MFPAELQEYLGSYQSIYQLTMLSSTYVKNFIFILSRTLFPHESKLGHLGVQVCLQAKSWMSPAELQEYLARYQSIYQLTILSSTYVKKIIFILCRTLFPHESKVGHLGVRVCLQTKS